MRNLVTRRNLIRLAGGGFAAGLVARAQSDTALPSLKDAAAKAGILFGSAASNRALEDPVQQPQFIRQCSILTPAGVMKWDELRPAPDQFRFTGADGFVDFAQRNHIAVHGHTLVWHEALPSWFASTVNASNAAGFLSRHISTVVGRYRSRIRYWDVINEVLDPSSHRADGLLNSPWLKLLGPGFIEQAFHLARQADPNATLVWNENNLEADNSYSTQKRRAMLRLLAELRKKQVPVGAIGMQGHLRPTFSKSNRDYTDFLKALKDTGVELLISELDVIDTDLPAKTRDQESASLYYDFVSVTCKTFKPAAIQVWELSDYQNWMDAMPAWRRKDGLPHRPAVLDEKYMPKPAFQKLLQALGEIEK